MKAFLLVIGLLGLRASAGTPAADLGGTARAGDRPQPNAVVWLDARTIAERLPFRAATSTCWCTAFGWGRFMPFARRAMAGARIRIPGGLTAQIAAGHQWRQQIQRDRTAFDFAVTYSFRRDIDTGRP